MMTSNQLTQSNINSPHYKPLTLMMPSTFTTFDLIVTYSSQPSFSYIYGLLPTMITMQLFWVTPSHLKMIYIITSQITKMLISSTNINSVKGAMIIMAPTFMSIITMNGWGAAPYTVTITSHLMTTLSMGSPMWASLLLISATNKVKSMSAHYLPEATPPLIASFLSMVETLSSYIRPITLSFRLSANISAGHVILGMVTSAATFTLMATLLMLILPLITGGGYTMFELMICVVQAFVFTLLASMYSNDYVNLMPAA